MKIAITAITLSSLGLFLLPRNTVILGNIEMDGGTESKDVDTSAIPPGSKMVGQITNKTGRPVDDVTMSVKRVGGSSTPPTSDGNSEVSEPGEGGGTSEAPNTDNSEGYSGNATFGGDSGGAPQMGTNVTYDFEIPVGTPGNGQIVKVYFTPSAKDESDVGDAHADLMRGFELTSGEVGATHRIVAPHHDRVSMYVSNAEDAGSPEKITSLSGTCTLPPGVTLSSVAFLNPSSGFSAVYGASIQIDGNSFQITGFSPMEAGRTYEIITKFSGVPVAGCLVNVTAEF